MVILNWPNKFNRISSFLFLFFGLFYLWTYFSLKFQLKSRHFSFSVSLSIFTHLTASYGFEWKDFFGNWIWRPFLIIYACFIFIISTKLPLLALNTVSFSSILFHVLRTQRLTLWYQYYIKLCKWKRKMTYKLT